jgi:uncharacterized membrane protein YozB (DUF420 family)
MQLLLPLHIVFMALSVVLIVAAVVTARARKPLWLKKHKTLALGGVTSALIAFVIIVCLKIAMHYSHFQSPHAIVGLVTFIFLIITPAVGAMVAKGPSFLRPVHKTLGRITSAAILLTALMGLARFLQLNKNRPR